jgi:hypothetical protein
MARTVLAKTWKPEPKAKRRHKPKALRHRKKLGPKSDMRIR